MIGLTAKGSVSPTQTNTPPTPFLFWLYTTWICMLDTHKQRGACLDWENFPRQPNTTFLPFYFSNAPNRIRRKLFPLVFILQQLLCVKSMKPQLPDKIDYFWGCIHRQIIFTCSLREAYADVKETNPPLTSFSRMSVLGLASFVTFLDGVLHSSCTGSSSMTVFSRRESILIDSWELSKCGPSSWSTEE